MNVSVCVQRVVTTSSSALTAGVSQNGGSVILAMTVETGLTNKTVEVLLVMSVFMFSCHIALDIAALLSGV